jgi:hypothetical protein
VCDRPERLTGFVGSRQMHLTPLWSPALSAA